MATKNRSHSRSRKRKWLFILILFMGAYFLLQKWNQTPHPIPETWPTPAGTPRPIPPISVRSPLLEAPDLSTNIYIEYILDASGSMMALLPDGTRKRDAAQTILQKRIQSFPPQVHIGLRVFGHRLPWEGQERQSCQDIELIAPVTTGQVETIVQWLDNFQAQGMTPLAQAMKLASQDLPRAPETNNAIVLISDGQETCGGDPCAMVKKLKQENIHFTLHIVGLNVQPQDAGEQLFCMARAGQGYYFPVTSAPELNQALEKIEQHIAAGNLPVDNPWPPSWPNRTSSRITPTHGPTITSTPTRTPTPTPSPTPTPRPQARLYPAPSLSAEDRAFWQSFLDALNAHDINRVAAQVDDIYLIFGPMIWGTPTPYHDVARWLVEGAAGGTVTCAGYDEESIVLEFPRRLQVPGVGDFGSLLEFYHDGTKVILINPYLDPEAIQYKAYWPCSLAGLHPAAEPDTFILRPFIADEQPERAIQDIATALLQSNATQLQKRLFPWVSQIRYASEGGILRSRERALEILLTNYGGPDLKCAYKGAMLYLYQPNSPDPTWPGAMIFLDADARGKYRIRAFTPLMAPDFTDPPEEMGLSPCPGGLPTWEGIPLEEQACIGSPRRLEVGQTAYVCTQYDTVALRAGPSKDEDRLARIRPGSYLLILDGPICDPVSGMWYWEVEVDGRIGWMAEGGDAIDPYYLCPAP